MDSSVDGAMGEVAGREQESIRSPDPSDSGGYVEYCGIPIWFVRSLDNYGPIDVLEYKKLLEMAP